MRVLVIDDAPDIVDVVGLCFELRWPGTEIVAAENGRKGVGMTESESPHLVILDIGLPDVDGFEVCREIRAFSDVPIIMLTVRNQDTDVVRGLQVGADDYITKPFSHLQLIARTEAVLRRTQSLGTAVREAPFLSGKLRADFDRRMVWVDGKEVKLTPIEYNLFYHLVRNAGRVLTHVVLVRKVWGDQYEDTPTNHLKVHIQHLRQKLGDDPQNPTMILTERGVGYRLVKAASEREKEPVPA